MLKLYHLTLNNKNMINNHKMSIGFITFFVGCRQSHTGMEMYMIFSYPKDTLKLGKLLLTFLHNPIYMVA